MFKRSSPHNFCWRLTQLQSTFSLFPHITLEKKKSIFFMLVLFLFSFLEFNVYSQRRDFPLQTLWFHSHDFTGFFSQLLELRQQKQYKQTNFQWMFWFFFYRFYLEIETASNSVAVFNYSASRRLYTYIFVCCVCVCVCVCMCVLADEIHCKSDSRQAKKQQKIDF